MSFLTESDARWLDEHAESLDAGTGHANDVLPWLARAELLGIKALPESIEAIAEVSGHSLTAGLVFWCQRAVIQCVANSPNKALSGQVLPRLLSGELAGAPGLSNAMKFVCGIESLNVTAKALPASRWSIQGSVPWSTNLRDEFIAIVTAARTEGEPPMVVALPSNRAGLSRGADMALMGLNGSHTAMLTMQGLEIGPDDVVAEDASRYLPQTRPAFLGLQLGLSIGLARTSLRIAQERGAGIGVIAKALAAQQARLTQTTQTLYQGLEDGRFLTRIHDLFGLRLTLADIVQQALQLELQASGGRAYSPSSTNMAFARRWRESAFITVITPSVTQLQGELEKLAA